MPKISVVVPVYNMETEVRDCLDSLVAQTEKEIEIIAIDDNSTDQSLEVLKEYARKYPNIKVYHNPENVGQSETRNRGIGVAEGNYIAFLDSDDYINPVMYQELYDAAEKNGFPELVTTDVTFVKNDEYLRKDLSFLIRRPPIVIHPEQDKDAVFDQSPSPCNKIFRADTIKNYKFLKGRMWEDIAFSFTKFLEADTVVHVPNTNYFYRRDISSGVSAINFHDNNRIDDIFAVADELGDELKRVGKYDEFESQIRTLQIAICLQRVDEVKQWDASEERKSEVKNYIFSTMYEKYGSMEGTDDMALQCKAGFKVVDEYKEFIEKDATKGARK